MEKEISKKLPPKIIPPVQPPMKTYDPVADAKKLADGKKYVLIIFI